MIFRGRVWKFGNDVNTDMIIPGRYLDNYDPAHLASHAMEGLDEEFAKKVGKGDLIVAGKNFGCGSSREQAVIALGAAGVSAVVAKSFARIFYRNAINLGLAALVSKEASDVFVDGDSVVLDSALGQLKSADGTRQAETERLPAHIERILASGGLVPHLKNKMGEESTKKNV